MEGKTCLVTGGTSGVGKATAIGLARAGAQVVIVTRSEARGARTAAEIEAKTGSRKIDLLVGDLGSIDSVRDLADRFRARYASLNVLSNNAALMTLHPRKTADGVNEIVAVDYLGHFLLTNLLLDPLRRSTPSRIITVAGQPSVVERVTYPEEGLLGVADGRPLRATLNAVLAKALFARELARRLSGTGVTSNLFHPGLVRSGLASGLPWYLRIPFSIGNAFLRETCSTSVFLATDESVQSVTGTFFVNSKPAAYNAPPNEESLAHRLWEESSRLARLQ